jgi:A/G-specific adenine glycosylase
MMELGATICLPAQPQCLLCPVSAYCRGRQAGRQDQLPIKSRKLKMTNVERAVVVVEGRSGILMYQRPSDAKKLRGFWDLPEPDQLNGVQLGKAVGEFRHSIVNHNYQYAVLPGVLRGAVPDGMCWVSQKQMGALPVSTRARKAMSIWDARS